MTRQKPALNIWYVHTCAEDERKGLDHYKYVADQLNIAGERCKKSGIQLCYHNHNFEFVKQNDTYPYDILLAADKNLVKMEMDIYWIKKAGQDPVALFNAASRQVSFMACERYG